MLCWVHSNFGATNKRWEVPSRQGHTKHSRPAGCGLSPQSASSPTFDTVVPVIKIAYITNILFPPTYFNFVHGRHLGSLFVGRRVLVRRADEIWCRGTVNAQVGGGNTFGTRMWQVLFDDLTTARIVDGEKGGMLPFRALHASFGGGNSFAGLVHEQHSAKTSQP